jgi:hypothetical protein
MGQAANTIDEYVELQSRQRWRSVPAGKLELVRKSYAQQLARSASQSVTDRRKRAELKAEIYSHLLPLLEMHAREQAATRAYYQKIVVGLTAGLLIATAVIALLVVWG